MGFIVFIGYEKVFHNYFVNNPSILEKKRY